MRYTIDLDDTLIIYPDSHLDSESRGGPERYPDAVPHRERIKKLNKLYRQGHTIIINTGRGWNQFEFTKKQLKEFNIKHHGLVMGRPLGTFIDVDSLRELP